MHTDPHTNIYRCAHTRAHNTHTCPHMDRCVHTCTTHTCTNMCIHVCSQYTPMYTHTHVYTHTHTYKHRRRFLYFRGLAQFEHEFQHRHCDSCRLGTPAACDENTAARNGVDTGLAGV